MYADTLLLMALGRYHNIGFVKHKDVNLSDVKYTEFRDPIENFSRSTNYDVIIKGWTTWNCTKIWLFIIIIITEQQWA